MPPQRIKGSSTTKAAEQSSNSSGGNAVLAVADSTQGPSADQTECKSVPDDSSLLKSECNKPAAVPANCNNNVHDKSAASSQMNGHHSTEVKEISQPKKQLPVTVCVRVNSVAKRGAVTKDERDRVLMRQWIENVANAGTLSGLQWYDRNNNLVKISWKHGSKSGWSKDDCEVFIKWAEYTGRYNVEKGEFKRWKANFRCALNSLPDVEEVKNLNSLSNNGESYKVYLLKEEVPRKRSKRSSESSSRSRSRSASSLVMARSDRQSIDSIAHNISSSLFASPMQRVVTLPMTSPTTNIHHWLFNDVGAFVTLPCDPRQQLIFADPMAIQCETVEHSYADTVDIQPSNVPIPTFVEGRSINELFEDEEDENEVVDSSGIILPTEQINDLQVLQPVSAVDQQQQPQQVDSSQTANDATMFTLLPLSVVNKNLLDD